MAEKAADKKDADAIISCTNGGPTDDNQTPMEARGESREDVSEESSPLDSCDTGNGVGQSEEAQHGDNGESGGEENHSNEPASEPPPLEEADQAVAVETREVETTEAEEGLSSDPSDSVQVEEEQPQCDPPSGGANGADPEPDEDSPTMKTRSPSVGPPETRRRDVAKCSFNMYNTVSYRNIRKGNTRQRIDEFESMMYTN